MPTCVCVVKAGLLNDEKKQRIASAITRLHSETTGAPTWLVQVVIDENEHRQRYLNGHPADHQIWIRGDIRAGRTTEQRQRLMLGIVQAISEISRVEESAIWVYLCSATSRRTIWWNTATCCRGRVRNRRGLKHCLQS